MHTLNDLTWLGMIPTLLDLRLEGNQVMMCVRAIKFRIHVAEFKILVSYLWSIDFIGQSPDATLIT